MKKNLTKVLALALSGAMAFSLAGCSGGSSNETTKAAENGAATATANANGIITEGLESGTLSVTIWDTNQQAGLQEIMDTWSAATGVKVELNVVPWDQYWTLLESGATGGDLPDVFWMHSNNAYNYMSSDMLMDLTADLKGTIDQYNQNVVGLYTYEDKYYAVPKDIDTIALWYNKTMFDKAGIKYPTADWTWDDFADAAKKLTTDDGKQFGYALKTSSNQDNWYNMVYSMGGNIISEDQKTSGMDNENTIKAMTWLTGVLKDSAPAYTTVSENGPDSLLQSGTIAMTLQGDWMVPAFAQNDYVVENCDVAVLPKDATTGKCATITNGLGWSVAKATDMPNASKSLALYLGSAEAQQKQSDLGVTMSALNDTKYSDSWQNTYKDKFAGIGAYVDMLNNAELIARPCSISTTAQWEDDLSTGLVSAFDGSADTTEVCKSLAASMNARLAQE